MSSPEHALASLLSQLALSFDGAFLGAALAYAAIRSILKLTATSTALRKIDRAPELHVSDLRSLLSSSENESRPSHRNENGGIVIVRGTVEAKSAVDGNWRLSRSNGVLVSEESGDKAVVVQRSQTYIYSEWRGIFQWTSGIGGIFGRSSRKQESASLRMVPFVLIENAQQPQSNYVVVNMDGSSQPLPLTTVYHHLQPINPSPYMFLQAFFGHEYPVGLLDEEKILPLGIDITAVGTCSFKNGTPEIKSCKDIPYFLSEMTKEKIMLDLKFRMDILFWSSIVLGSLSIGILGYAIVRNWNRWKEWRGRRRSQQQNHDSLNDANLESIIDEDIGDIPDGQLCVICLMRRRVPAFIPCGHIACCQTCALSIERELAPKCPVCRQAIRGSMRVFYA